VKRSEFAWTVISFVVNQRNGVVLSNRPTLVLTFKPKAGDLPSGCKAVQDKLLEPDGRYALGLTRGGDSRPAG